MIRIRLQRRGRRKRPIYHIVVADSRSPRDGRIIEDLGRFDNVTPRNQVTLNQERAIYWIQKGAQPSDTVRSILKELGILYRVHLMNWGKSEEEIEQALTEWREAREAKEGSAPSRKERQRALLEAEEKEYQKQLKKKAEEAARQKAKEEALASEEEDEAEETEAADSAETDTTEADEPEVQKEAEKEAADEESTEAESSSEENEEAGSASEPEVQKEAEKEATEESSESADEEDDNETEESTKSGSGSELSTNMTAKEAIDHINNSDIDELDGFVPDDEDRVTVQRAWESKQEE